MNVEFRRSERRGIFSARYRCMWCLEWTAEADAHPAAHGDMEDEDGERFTACLSCASGGNPDTDEAAEIAAEIAESYGAGFPWRDEG